VLEGGFTLPHPAMHFIREGLAEALPDTRVCTIEVSGNG